MDSIRRAATAGAAFSLVSIIAMRACGFLTSLLLAHTLEPQDFGRYSILLGFNAVGVLVAGLGITIIAPKLVAESVDRGQAPGKTTADIIRSVITIAAGLGLLVGGVMAISAPLLAGWMLGEGVPWTMLAIVGASVSAMAWSASIGACLQGLHDIRRLSFLNAAVSAFYLVLAIPAARWFGVTGAFAAMALSHVGFTLAGAATLPRGARGPRWTGETGQVLERGMRLGWPLLISSLALALSGWLIRTWLGQTADLAEVGRYQVAETLNQAILFAPLALAIPLFPLASTMADASREEKARAFGPAFAYVALFSLPVAIIVGWGARLWVGFFGPDYHSAWPIVYLMTAGYFLQSLGSITGALLAGFGLTLDSLKLTVLWSGLFVLGGLVLAPRFGAAGVAAAQVGASLVHVIVLAIYFRRRLGIRFLAAPRLLVTFAGLFAIGGWLLPRVEPLLGALLALPAIAVVLLNAGDLPRRVMAHGSAWLRDNQGP
ncbi:MAG: oligosaccharide flippase family protein [Candidatus Eisenbacteria bacterium]|nr:oligosaccharide flippase family protein [Candidatus Eisenbacteria bacterium]